MTKKYCYNCRLENDKSSRASTEVSSNHWGRLSHIINGCGRESIEFKEDATGYSFIPQRNKDHKCSWYRRKWWKVWVIK